MAAQSCRLCSAYDRRTRWCEYGEDYVRNPNLGRCHGYDGPLADEDEDAEDEDADFALNCRREAGKDGG